jgi:hypothetical protein
VLAQTPNPYLASDVNRRTADGGRFLLLPRRYNRTAVDRIAPDYAEGFRTRCQPPGCTKPLQGSAALPLPAWRLRACARAPETHPYPAPASQTGGLGPAGPCQLDARSTRGQPGGVLSRGPLLLLGDSSFPPSYVLLNAFGPAGVPGANPSGGVGGPGVRSLPGSAARPRHGGQATLAPSRPS